MDKENIFPITGGGSAPGLAVYNVQIIFNQR